MYELYLETIAEQRLRSLLVFIYMCVRFNELMAVFPRYLGISLF